MQGFASLQTVVGDLFFFFFMSFCCKPRIYLYLSLNVMYNVVIAPILTNMLSLFTANSYEVYFLFVSPFYDAVIFVTSGSGSGSRGVAQGDEAFGD